MMKYEISIDGMGCQMCVKKVTGALQALGASDICVEIGKASCTFEGTKDELKTAVEDVGFDVSAIKAE